jgi:hypothetical protein
MVQSQELASVKPEEALRDMRIQVRLHQKSAESLLVVGPEADMPVYPDDIPSFIPPTVYGRQVLRYITRTLMYLHRCWMVVVAWLIILPLANMGGLKTFRWFADFA